MRALPLRLLLVSAIPFQLFSVPCRAQTASANFYAGMSWRNIGPFRGGRVSAVTGVVGQPGTFYMGLPMGGVWKTTGAGTTWYPVFDSIKVASSVGSVEAAPSDPNIIYVGMGDMLAGGGISRGNGLYKSTDAGATWSHIGLDKTCHIPTILVDPHDSNIVMAAAMGDANAKSDARGLYRSTDGGASWKKTLYIDDSIGVQKIAWAYDNPKIMLATTNRAYTPPGQGRGGFGGGGAAATGKLYRSMDEGVTWTEITGGGLPTISGRTCVAIAMNTNSQRMYLVGNFGLYRSDDGGTKWRRMDASDRRVSNGQGGYNCGVYVNSQNPDIVYVVNTCCYRSLDGGNTFTGFKGAPGGDDPQQLWIDPTNGNRLLFGTDQGATVSLDGGLTWGSWYNQPTAQVYHISVDNRFPYWVYATQQDSGSIGTSSRGNLGAITPLDWLPHPGYEFGSIVADPIDPRISYAGGPGGGIIRTTYPSGQWIDVSPSVNSSLTLRKARNQPLLFSPTNPHELLAGFQCLMATTDGGKQWRKLSSDLTVKPGEAPVPPPASRPVRATTGQSSPEEQEADEHEADDEEDEDGQRGAFGAAIDCFAVSNVDGNILWVGTTNGIVQLSRDHGETWEDVSIPGLPDGARSDISSIDASHFDTGTAYVAVDSHGAGDLKPYVYRTRDFGKTWKLIVEGLPDDEISGSFTRVVRADTKRNGLVFAGTESSVYVSFDDGDHWHSLALNLPNTSYRDMVVKGDDLVVGTFGRGFWILDDISPLRQGSALVGAEPVRLFKPAEAIRVRRNVNGDTPFPPEIPHAENPPLGAIIYYYLDARPTSDISIDIKDSHGHLIRRLSSVPVAKSTEAPPPVPDFWVEKPQPLPASPGLNRTNWDLKCEGPPAFAHTYEINANPGETPASPEGPLAPPGMYEITLTVNGKSYKQSLAVKNDPRAGVPSGDLERQFELQMKLVATSREAWKSYHKITEVRATIAALLDANPPAEVEKAAQSLDDKLAGVGGSSGFGGRGGGGGPGGGFGGGPPRPTFTSIIGAANRQINVLSSGDMAPNEIIRQASKTVITEMAVLVKSWEAISTKDLPALNAIIAKNNLKPITLATK